MPVSHIEHFLVAADDIDATRDWYARVLGMQSDTHPDFGLPVICRPIWGCSPNVRSVQIQGTQPPIPASGQE